MRSYSRRDVHGPVAEEELVDAHRGKGRAQRHTGRALRPAHPVGGPKTIGLVAEEAPDLVRRDNNIDLYSLTSLSVAGVQELDAEHNALAERVADLERLVKRS